MTSAAEFNSGFVSESDQALGQDFLASGYHIFDIEHPEALSTFKTELYTEALRHLDGETPSPEEFFDRTQDFIPLERLNDIRVRLIRYMGSRPEFRPMLYSMAKTALHRLVGNELAMQRALNLSIQLPQDESSLLPLHSDVWSGNSPYEVVLWLPLVDVFKTKSMYVLPRHLSDAKVADFKSLSTLTAEGLYKEIERDAVFLEVPFGKAVLFSHSIMHGNRINQEPSTRWTLNVRFKSLLTPYCTKELGESFLPITVKPATRIGYSFQKPGV